MATGLRPHSLWPRWLRSSSLVWALAWHSALGAAAATAPVDPIAEQAKQAIWLGDFERLQRLYEQSKTQHARNPVNGQTPTQSLRSGIYAIVHHKDFNDAYFRELVLLTGQWAKAQPQSALAHLLHARALHAHAWHVRGTSYWASVPEPAKAEFLRLRDLAIEWLVSHSDILQKESTTFVYLLKFGREASWPSDRLRELAARAADRAPDDAFDLHAEVVAALMPIWGGSWPQVENYIDEVRVKASTEDGPILYARLWAVANGSIEGNLFKQTGASWPRIKSGYEALIQQFSGPQFLNQMAYMACLAEDRPSTRSALARLNQQPDLAQWRGGGAGGRPNYEACVRWAAQEP